LALIALYLNQNTVQKKFQLNTLLNGDHGTELQMKLTECNGSLSKCWTVNKEVYHNFCHNHI